MDNISITLNDVVGYILLGVVYLFHFVNSRQTKVGSMLLKKDMTNKVSGVQNNVDKISAEVNDRVNLELTNLANYVKDFKERNLETINSYEQLSNKVTELESKITITSDKLILLENENDKLKKELLVSVTHNEELCKKGITKQITKNLKGGSDGVK